MGKKKAAGQEAVNVKLAPQFLCYYCDTRHEDEYKLVQHQRSKHFLCRLCVPSAYGRNCLSLGGLVSHVRRSHRKEVKEVPNAVEGRESLDVEVSGMNGIPDDVRIEFENKLAEEADQANLEAQRVAAERPERPEPTQPEPSRKNRYEAPEEPKWEPPPLPEEPARPPVAFAMLPETGSSDMERMASRLANQLQQQTSALAMGKEAPPLNLFPFTLPEPSTPAFDPGQLAARIAAAKLESEREEMKQAQDEADAAARARRGASPLAFKKDTVRDTRPVEPEPKRPAPRKNSQMKAKLLAMEESAVLKYAMDVGVPEDQLDKIIDATDAKATIADFIIELEAKEAWMTVTFKAGKLGITADWATGYVESITPGSQAQTNGIKPGMTIKTINGQQYAKSILQAKIGGTKDYKVMFAQSEEIQRAKEANQQRQRSRSRKPYRSRSRGRGGGGGGGRGGEHKGSLKFRPRSMNRGPDQRQESDRRDRDNRDDVASNKRTNEDSRRGEYQRRRDEDDDRRGGDDRRKSRGDEGRRDDRKGDKRKRDQSPSPDGKNSRKTGWGDEDKDELTLPLPPLASQMPPTAPMPQGMPGAVVKNEMCMSFTEGLCTKGGMCPHAHALHDLAPGGYKPRLCPSFMRGGCTRGVICMYAHKREELPPNFKCIPCQNYSTGFCRKQQICPFAHGAEEQGWFTEFMGGEAREGGRDESKAKAQLALTNMPKMPGMVPPAAMEMSMADNVMAAAEAQLQQGLSITGQLDMPKVPKAVAKLSSTPKINMAANPAMKAPAAGLLGPAFAKGGPPPGAVAKGGSPATR